MKKTFFLFAGVLLTACTYTASLDETPAADPQADVSIEVSEPGLADDVRNFVEEAREEAFIWNLDGAEISDVKAITFDWSLKTDEGYDIQTIQGWGYEMSGLLYQEDQTDALLEEKGFEYDWGNMADGTIEWRGAYRREDMVCVVNGFFTNPDLEMGEGDEEIQQELQCGLLSS